jgi:gliding motility-associated lipoprotein GldH
MKRVSTFIYTAAFAFLLLLGSGCTDPGAVIDENIEIANKNWSYQNKIGYDVKIDNATIPYNLYLNLRITGDYKYSNLYALISNPDKKGAVNRYEFKLANPAGEWLGQGSGNLYSYQIPFRTNYKFPANGTYHIRIEQNMRDNPLHEVSDVGLRVEKAQ